MYYKNAKCNVKGFLNLKNFSKKIFQEEKKKFEAGLAMACLLNSSGNRPISNSLKIQVTRNAKPGVYQVRNSKTLIP